MPKVTMYRRRQSLRATPGLFLAAIVALAFAFPAHASRVFVTSDGDSTQPGSFRFALQRAAYGDSLLLSPGTYRGSFNLKKGVSLFGVAGPDSTILDGAGERYCLVGRWIDSTTVVAGLTMRNGRRDHPNSGGGGMYLYQSSPVVIGNVFRDHLGYFGAGVYLTYGCRAVVAFNRFEANEAHLGGAFAAYLQCEPLVYANSFVGNRAGSGGAILFMNSTGLVRENLVRENSSAQGAGAYFDSAPALIQGNEFRANLGDAVLFALDDDAPCVIRDNVFAENEGNDFGGAMTKNAQDPAHAGERSGDADHAPLAEPRLPRDLASIPIVPDSVLAEWRDWIQGHPAP